jgi:hypothetical protein
MQFSKMDIIERQTNTAIELLLAGGDKVSTHTLVFAALRVARDLAKANGTVRHYQFDSLIKPNEKPFSTALSKAANFFKHADRDPLESLDDFDPNLNEYLIWWTLMLYSDLGGKLSNQMQVFTSWMVVQDGIVAPESTSQFFSGKTRLGDLFKECQGLSQEDAFVALNIVLQSRLRATR